MTVDPVTSPPPRPSRPWRAPLLAIFLLLPIAVIQLWISTAGWVAWSRGSQYVSLLADAFMHGQVSLRVAPPPEMLALPDPYDPQANSQYRLHDATLYHGKYYLYWGPVPAILTAAVFEVLRRRPDFGDQHLVFAFLFGAVAAAALLMFRIRARFFPGLSAVAIAIPIVSLGLGAPVLFTLARPAIYEATIAAGQFFLLTGFLAAFAAMATPDQRHIARCRWLFLAGLLWSLSAGSRMSLIPAIAVAEGITLFFLHRQRRFSLGAAVGLVTPLVAVIVLLAIYNYARFGDFLETGQRWQLGGRNPNAQSPHDFFHLYYFPIDAYCYFLTSPAWLRSFPFAYATGRMPPFASHWTLPDGFRIEALVGLPWTQPFLICAIFVGVGIRRSRSAAFDANVPNENRQFMPWLTTTLAAAGLIGFAPALFFENVTMRYLLDGVPCFTILAAIGFWGMLQRQSTTPRRILLAMASAVITAQIALAILLALTGYNGNFVYYNPALFQSMKTFFDRI